MNLYIFNESSRAAVYGIGTYIRELTKALCQSSINVCVVNLMSDKPQILKEEIDGIRHWYFPKFIPEQRTIDFQKQIGLYYRNVVYLRLCGRRDDDARITCCDHGNLRLKRSRG